MLKITIFKQVQNIISNTLTTLYSFIVGLMSYCKLKCLVFSSCKQKINTIDQNKCLKTCSSMLVYN